MKSGRAALITFALLVGGVGLAPAVAPHDPGRQFTDYPFAPPMRVHVRDASGAWHAPFAYALQIADPLERRYEEDRSTRLPVWSREAPVFILGTDGLGRDMLARVLGGARLSLGVAVGAALLALAIGALVGGAAGYLGGAADEILMRLTDLVLVLPAIYVVVTMRGALPLVLSTSEIFLALVIVMGLVGWPAVARGVRAIVRVERTQEYAEAARALGATRMRVLVRHLLPATRGFLIVQGTLLVPAFVMAEATLSFVGLGFLPPAPSWGAMLQDAANVQTTADAPWLLAPAAAIVVTVFVIQVVTGLTGFRTRRQNAVTPLPSAG